MATSSCVSEKPVLGGKKAEQILADEQNIEQANFGFHFVLKYIYSRLSMM